MLAFVEPMGEDNQRNVGFTPLVGPVYQFPLTRSQGQDQWLAPGAVGHPKLVGGRLASLECEISAGAVIPLHFHPSSTEVVRVVEGKMVLECKPFNTPWETHILGDGGMWTVPEGQPHSGRYLEDTRVTITFDPPIEVVFDDGQGD